MEPLYLSLEYVPLKRSPLDARRLRFVYVGEGAVSEHNTSNLTALSPSIKLLHWLPYSSRKVTPLSLGVRLLCYSQIL